MSYGALSSTSRRRVVLVALLLALLAPVVLAGRWTADERSDVFAAVAFAPAPGRAEANRKALVEQVRQAVRDGARYVVLPELATTGALDRLPDGMAAALGLIEPIPGPTTETFAALAQELRVWIALSLPESADAATGDAGYFVTTVLLDPHGELAAVQRKVMPRFDGGDGPARRGDPRVVLDTIDDRGRRIGVLAGDDLLAGVPQLANRGADTILITAGWGVGEPVDWAERCAHLAKKHAVNLVVAERLEPGAEPARAGVVSHRGEALGLVAALALRAGERSPSALGLPSVPVPTSSETSPRLVELGRMLFFDRALSRDGSIACASCHQPEKGFSNGEKNGAGIYRHPTTRNVPSLLNVAWKAALFWDGYASTLENQAKYPTTHAFEMDSPYLDELTRYVRGQERYREGFEQALGTAAIGFDEVALALAAYQRALVSANSPFDRHVYGGQHEALPASARRGLALFAGKAGCASCHTMGRDYALLTDNQFHNNGVGYDPAAGRFTDGGLGLLSDASRSGLFMTPTLRNVADTAPYMHDGSLATLEQVVAYYDRGATPNPGLDARLRPLGLTAGERADLAALLRAFTGDRRFTAEGVPVERPRTVPLPAGESARLAVVRFAPLDLGAKAFALGAPGAPGALEANRAAIAERIARAAAQGAAFVVLPEHAETGPLGATLSATDLGALARRQEEESLPRYADLARRHAVWLAAPTLEVDAASGKLYQSIVLFGPDGVEALRQRKLAPRRERGDAPAAPGDVKHVGAAWTPLGWVGVLAGDDLQDGVPRLAELGVSAVLVSASWRPSDAVDWDALAVELATRYRVHLLVSNLVERAAGATGAPGALGAAEATGATEPTLFLAMVGGNGVVTKLKPPASTEIVTASLPARPAPPGIERPLGLPPLPMPAHRSASEESVELGHKLFFDPRLSADGSVSCGSCHRPETAFSDGLKVARGIADRDGHRNTPSLLNSVYRPWVFWEGRTPTLEEQVGHALQGWAEMNSHPEAALAAIRREPEYRRLFRRVTGSDEITFDDLAAALASYERTLLSGNSPFDRWYYGGDPTAVSERAKRGFKLFVGAARCASCHTIGEEAALFSDHRFHNTGVGYHVRFEYLGYGGNGLPGNLARDNRFRGEYLTPTLRDIARTAPYMHDGSVATLADAVELYVRGGVPNPDLDRGVRPVTGLSQRDKDDLVEFLYTLSGEVPRSERERGRTQRRAALRGGGR